MTKVAGSYESVVRGVSQQVPQDRRPGQHFEQVNMVSDPVRGTARRHGSVMQDEVILGAYNENGYSDILDDSLYHGTTSFYVSGKAYDIVHRRTPGSVAMGRSTFAHVFDKDTRTFVPITYATDDPVLDQLIAGGVSASVNVGRFVYFAGNTIVPSFTGTDVHGSATNQSKFAAWVRGGAYSRTFRIILTRPDGTKVTVSYKTASSSYPELLSTTDLLTSDPDYQKKVNDRVNAYNSQVTAWIGTAAEDITPTNIATKLAAALTAAGVTGVTRVDGTVFIDNTTFSEIQSEDGGDGSLIHAVGNEVLAADLVSTLHFAGKVVKVRPRSGREDEAFYLRAYPKIEGATGTVEVAWKEAPGYIMQPDVVLAMGTVEGGVFYLAGGPAKLEAVSGVSTPTYSANPSGDDLTSPIPSMFGSRISYLGMFQDRLMIGSGAVILASRPGDYLNWFRQSVLAVIDNDPWEGYALGAEDDVIRHSLPYDRNLLLYGERFQYIISGRQPLTPKTASIVTVSKYEDATDAAPQAAGNLVFYAMYSGVEAGREKASVHQVQPSQLQDNPESYNVSAGLDTYIAGKPVEITALTAPNMLLLRTDAARNELYTYTYLDSLNATERLIDSWSRWQWDSAVGDIIGLSQHQGAILVYVYRHGVDVTGNPKVWVACEQFVRDSHLSQFPYLDSLRPVAAVTSPESSAFLHAGTEHLAKMSAAFVRNSEYKFLGSPMIHYDTFEASYPGQMGMVYSGVAFQAYFTPTNPFERDRNGQAKLAGRTTVTRFVIALADTGGATVDISSTSGSSRSIDFVGRVLGDPSNTIGRQPIVSTSISAVVGKEVREFSYTIGAKTWLPLTVTAIEWVGQSFNYTRRV